MRAAAHGGVEEPHRHHSFQDEFSGTTRLPSAT